MCRHLAYGTGFSQFDFQIVFAVGMCNVGGCVTIHVIWVFAIMLSVDGNRTVIVAYAAPVVVSSVAAGCGHIVALDEVTTGHTSQS